MDEQKELSKLGCCRAGQLRNMSSQGMPCFAMNPQQRNSQHITTVLQPNVDEGALACVQHSAFNQRLKRRTRHTASGAPKPP